MTPPTTSEPTPNLPEPSVAAPLARDGGASEPTGRFREGLVERSGEGRPHVVRRLVAKGKRARGPGDGYEEGMHRVCLPLTDDVVLAHFHRLAEAGPVDRINLLAELRRSNRGESLRQRHLYLRGMFERSVLETTDGGDPIVLAPPIIVACAAMIREDVDGCYLGVSRKDDHNDWGWPAGKREPGETLEACALRELLEETGLIGEIVSHVYTGRDGGAGQCAAFEVRVVGKVARAEGETGRVDLVTKEQLFAGRWGDYNRRAIAAFEALRSTPPEAGLTSHT